MSDAQKELPKYKCHKEVWALKIGGIIGGERHSGIVRISPLDQGYSPFDAPAGWVERYKGSADDHGYYVVYKGGYASWSPSREFEEGYTKI